MVLIEFPLIREIWAPTTMNIIVELNIGLKLTMIQANLEYKRFWLSWSCLTTSRRSWTYTNMEWRISRRCSLTSGMPTMLSVHYITDYIGCWHQRMLNTCFLMGCLQFRFGVYTTAQHQVQFLQDESLTRQHVRHMANMIVKLKEVGQPLTDEQHIELVIRSLPNLWEQMKVSTPLNTFEGTLN